MKSLSTKVVFICCLLFSFVAFAGEESLDLDTVSAPPPPKSMHSAMSKFSIMGRMDLTYEKTIDGDDSLDNSHKFLLFLKLKASEKTSVMGEFVSRAFYYIDYAQSDLLTVTFGRILVPFGDNRYFHRYYGGVQGYAGSGVMFPNIWALPGANLAWKLGPVKLDTYVINDFDETGGDVDFQSAVTNRQGLGARATMSLLDKTTLIVSGYHSDYWELGMGGVDFYTDYGAFGLNALRLSAGIASASVGYTSTGTDFVRRGDYLQLATNVASSLVDGMEWRVRYGTYEHDDRLETIEDTQSLNVGTTFNVDVMKVLIEHQWNYEAVNETDNDLGRVMVSLDF